MSSAMLTAQSRSRKLFDFFEANKGRSLDDAIKCWKYKKSMPGHNRYEDSDLSALDKD